MTKQAPLASFSLASAGEGGALSEADLATFERVAAKYWERFNRYQDAVTAPSGTAWHDTKPAHDFDYMLIEEDGHVTFRGYDRDGDSFSSSISTDLLRLSDAEFDARIADAEAEVARRKADAAEIERKRQAQAIALLEKAQQRERDRIFREEAKKRGIEVPE